MTFTLFIFTNQPIENMLEALEHLKMPGIVATVIYLAYRYGFLIFIEAQTLLRALKSRLFKPQLSLRSLPVYGEMAGGLFIKSLNRSETVYRAMSSRGFRGQMPISPSRHIVINDIGRMSIPVVFILILILIGQVVR
jgi:cobalt/nickel transport system permease protein